MNAHALQKEESRKDVIVKASRIIDALKGKEPGVHSMAADPGREFASAPQAIPAIGWTNTLPGAEEDKNWTMHVVGNVGEFYSHRFSNERPSDTFNVGFYAGILAAKAGLVVMDDFRHDSELRRGAAMERLLKKRAQGETENAVDAQATEVSGETETINTSEEVSGSVDTPSTEPTQP